MNPKSTWFGVAVAAGLFAFIFFFERHHHQPPPGPARILPALDPATVDQIQILPKGQLEIRLQRTNGVWWITRPFTYPAQTTGVDGMLRYLTNLTCSSFIAPQELKNVHKAAEEYGLEPPQLTFIFQHGDEQNIVHLGYKTAPGDQMFLQVVGVGEIYIVDASALQQIPVKADDWRDPMLADFSRLQFDRVLVTNAGRAFELQRNPTNKLWRLLPPGREARADNGKVDEAIQKLMSLHAGQFVTDDPKADLDSYGLLTPELSLSLAHGTNPVLLLDFGKNSGTNRVYARRHDLSSVITVDRDSLAPWRAGYEVFRDRHLVPITGPIDSIEFKGRENFTVQRQPGNAWKVLPDGFAADPAAVNQLVNQLNDLKAAEFFKAVITAPDLPAVGLAPPSSEIILKFAVTNRAESPTNAAVVKLEFGTNHEGTVFVLRTDETSLYTIKPADYEAFPTRAWELRDRQIWNFDAADVAKFIIQMDGKTRGIDHQGTNRWSLAAGSQGIINDLAMEEVAYRLGRLGAAAWVDRGDQNAEALGFNTNSYHLTVQLRDGKSLGLDLGALDPSGVPYGRVQLDGQPWIFELPPGPAQFIKDFLIIPPYLH